MKTSENKVICGLGLLLAAANTTAFANHLEPAGEPRHGDRRYQVLSTYLGIGYGFGGDELGRFLDSDGELDKIHSGGGLLLEAGLSLAVDPSTSLRLTSGYQADGTSRLNGDSLFDRLRFDLTLLRRFDAHEFGVGLTTHTSVGYSCNINSICDGDVEFDHAVGYTLEYAVKIGNGYYSNGRSGDLSGLSLGIRYTGIDYRPRLADAATDDLTSGNTLLGFIGLSF